MNSDTKSTDKEIKKAQKGGLGYRFIEFIPGMKFLVRKGGILLKWGMITCFVTMLIVASLSVIFIFMSTASLKSSARQLCQTIGGNISSSESIITAERDPFKRSLVLQDIVTSLSKNNVQGLSTVEGLGSFKGWGSIKRLGIFKGLEFAAVLEYATVYDISGNLVEQKNAYAAHTKAVLRGKIIPRDIFKEIRNVKEFQEGRIMYVRDDKSEVPCYRYRMPFKFFDVQVGVIEVAFTEESILGPVNRMTLFIIIIGGVMLLVGIWISVAATKRMVHPINQLSEGINNVRAGNLDVELTIKRHDEIGDLSNEFNNLIVHLREKLQMQKFVSESTISMIKEHSKTGNIALGGKKQNLVFLFSDIRGFTAMSEKLQPEQVVSILNEYLDLQAQIIKKNKGDIDKFVGDEVMAAFSGPHKTDNAFMAAIEIMDSIKKLNQERMQQNLLTVEVGIGINGGDVVHGRMGSRDRMDNTSIGDAVNLAARLCSQAESGAIIVSKDVLLNASKGKFVGKKLEPIRVKGKAKPIDIFTITGMKE